MYIWFQKHYLFWRRQYITYTYIAGKYKICTNFLVKMLDFEYEFWLITNVLKTAMNPNLHTFPTLSLQTLSGSRTPFKSG